MSGLLVNFSIIYILIVALSVLHPWLSRKNVLFGVVFGSGNIRVNPEAKKIVGRFIAASVFLAAVLAAVSSLLFVFTNPSDSDTVLIFTLTVLVLVAVEGIPFILANRAMKALKSKIPDPNLVSDRITVEVGAKAEKEQRPVRVAWFLLLLAPVVVSVLLAVNYYPFMPDTIATHFNAAGAADAWQAKSVGMVMFPITMQIVISAILFLIGLFTRKAPSAVKGSPGAAPGYGAFRRFLTGWLIGFGILVQVNFMSIILLYAGAVQGIGTWITVFMILVIASVAVLIGAFFRMRRRGPEGVVYDDDSKWALGMFYYNPSDSSLFVEKRTGIGQTLNFGHPASWAIIAGIVALVVFSLTQAFG